MAKVRWLFILWFAVAVAAVALAPALVRAQATIHWEASIDSAKQAAAPSNRLVLVIFTAPQWCVACRALEADLNSQPSAGQAIESNYVAVKINADYYPNTAKQYNIKTLPTTIVLAPTPRGEVLDVIPQRLPLDQYLGRLNRVAEDFRRKGGPVAQIASVPPRPQAPGGQSPALPYGPPGAPAGQLASMGPTALQQPGAMPANSPARPGASIVAYPGVGPNFNSPTPNTITAGSPPPVNMPPVVGGNPNPSAAGPMRPSAPNNPTMALDGYCPVRLVENGVWAPGNTAWGAIHRGRTYLFAGEDERRRFMANPDRYAPVWSGTDIVVQLEQGRIVAGTREHGAQYGGHVYLFADEATLARFSANPKFYAQRAQEAARTNQQAAAQLR